MAPTFSKVTPSLPVSSVPESRRYYTEVLGFRIAGQDGDNHTWLQLASTADEEKSSTPVNVYIRRRTFPDIPNDVAFGKIHIRISGAEDELEQLLAKYKHNGAMILEEVKHMPWGLKHFTVGDPDGNILNFDQVIAGWKAPAAQGQ